MKRVLQILLPLLILAGVGWASHTHSTRVQQALERALNSLGQWRYLDIATESGLQVSSEDSARLYYDTADDTLKLSTGGNAYTPLAGGSISPTSPTDINTAWNTSSDGKLHGPTPNKAFGLTDPLLASREVAYRWNPSIGFEVVKPVGPSVTVLDTNSPWRITDGSGTALFNLTSAGTLTGIATQGSACAVIDNVAAADDNMLFLSAHQAMTIKTVWCNYQGLAPTTGAVFALEDGAGNAMTHTSPTCAAPGSVATAQNVTAGGSLTAREVLRFDVTNTPNPATDTYMLCVSYQLD
ncbi:MAG: hypothetical protein C4555_06330 [Dehalococcoidia bacterium]|nr:MAG: hypothetical protein C4555_06330 [Dehalococcoidia bacterium]